MEMDAIAPKQAPELERRRLAEGVADMHAVGRERPLLKLFDEKGAARLEMDAMDEKVVSTIETKLTIAGSAAAFDESAQTAFKAGIAGLLTAGDADAVSIKDVKESGGSVEVQVVCVMPDTATAESDKATLDGKTTTELSSATSQTVESKDVPAVSTADASTTAAAKALAPM